MPRNYNRAVWDTRTRTVILDARLVGPEIDRIMGDGFATAEQLSNFLKRNNSGDYATRFIDQLDPNLAQLYVEEADKEGVNVNQGDRVSKGDQIGVMGNTGHSTGPHLHMEIRRLRDNVAINPESLIDPIT